MEDNDSDEDENGNRRERQPGPGSYATHDTTFRIDSKPLKMQFFGSNVSRFSEKPIGTELGPGQYAVGGRPFEGKILRQAGTSAFKASGRIDPMAALVAYDLPGPGEYLNDGVLETIATKT